MVIDDVAVVAAALSDVVSARSVGPVDELSDDDLEDLLERLRGLAEDLQARIASGGDRASGGSGSA